MFEVDGKVAKKAAEEAHFLHAQDGCCIVALGEGEGVGMLSLHSEAVKGREISNKKVRQMLWWERKRRCLQRGNAAVWTVYDEKMDMTHFGLGAIVDQRTFDRGRERGMLGTLFEVSNAIA